MVPKKPLSNLKTILPYIYNKISGKAEAWTGESAIKAADSPSIDAFARLRVSNPTTLFDSKQLYDKQPLFWDDQETSGTGTSSTFSAPNARTQIAVGATTAGTRVRQTFQRFNYQPGKSMLIFLTGVLGTAESGITQRIGYFDDDNGLIFNCEDAVMKVTRRTNVTGSAVDNDVAQADWNLDTMDGNGPSGVTLDFTKTQIFLIDFEWLGVGRVRMGFVIDGIPIYCHQFLNTNILTEVYMSTPNLPLRYEISNDGTGGASTLDHICSTVISEGGQQRNGILRHFDSGSVSSLAAGTTYALIGLRLQEDKLGSIELESISLLSSSQNDQAHWELKWNPTVAGTFTYADETNSIAMAVGGVVTNTVTGGTDIDGGYFSTAQAAIASVPNALKLGADIAGVQDEIVLCVTPVTNNITVEASLTWRELS